jgi:hypothetical protein
MAAGANVVSLACGSYLVGALIWLGRRFVRHHGTGRAPISASAGTPVIRFNGNDDE